MKSQHKTVTSIDHVALGRRVLEQEIEGLKALEASLDHQFNAAVELIAGLKGRLMISGMGKSGHVGRKIAATMASTGTPAYFVHPGEASHGDLGAITPQDGVLALSNSGETAELTDLMTYTKRFGIPLIAMVRRRESMLAEAANVVLVLPDTAEASPVGAPTTSTTMMMALGDALAVALLERRGFTRDDFSVLHPGGRIGRGFIRVQNLMHGKDEMPLVNEQDSMREVLIVMTAKRFGCAGVVDFKGTLIGVVTDGDLRRHMQPELLEKKASDVMTQNPLTIAQNLLAAEALGIMNTRAITSLFVTDEGVPIGILHVHDCLRAGIM